MNKALYLHLFLYALLSAYGLGAALVESLVNYPSWLLIDEGSFINYHALLAYRISWVLVLPLLLKIPYSFWIYIKFKSLRFAMLLQLILQAVFWFSSVFWQIPIQAHLGQEGKSIELIHELIQSDLILRTTPHVLQIILIIGVLLKKVQQLDQGQSNP